jgi:mRNA-degrading endonuclease RelE of RelBE toxin-antitoxin system
MSDYRLLVAYEVFEFLETLASKDRKRLKDRFRQLNDPGCLNGRPLSQA